MGHDLRAILLGVAGKDGLGVILGTRTLWYRKLTLCRTGSRLGRLCLCIRVTPGSRRFFELDSGNYRSGCPTIWQGFNQSPFRTFRLLARRYQGMRHFRLMKNDLMNLIHFNWVIIYKGSAMNSEETRSKGKKPSLIHNIGFASFPFSVFPLAFSSP